MAFSNLPPELVLLIFRYLSTLDTSCLALCNHHFMAFSSSFDNLLGKPLSDDLRIDLLTRLARDLPQYYLCFACLRLHLWRYVELPSPRFKLRSCFDRKDPLSCPVQFRMFPTYSIYQFHFVHLYLAMRRHYFGPSFGIATESLLYTGVARTLTDAFDLKYPRRTGLMSIDARVCLNPSSLCLRIQNITVAKRQDVQNLFRHSDVPYDYRRKDAFQVCWHIDSTDTIKMLIKNYCRNDKDGTSQLCSGGKCDRCNTSWNVEVRELQEQDMDVCLVLTQWKDLGPGLSPEDDRWRSKQAGPSRWQAICRKALKASEKVDDPRIRFEMLSKGCNSPQALSVEEMFRRNMSLLRGRRYRSVMRQWEGWWYLQGKERESRCIII